MTCTATLKTGMEPSEPSKRPLWAWPCRTRSGRCAASGNLERLRDRRVVQKGDANRRAGDLRESPVQGLHVGRCLGVDLPNQSLAEVDPSAVEAPDEPLGADDADGHVFDGQHGRAPFQHDDRAGRQYLDDLARTVRVVVVISEDRDDGHAAAAPHIGEHLSLLGQPVRGQVAREEDQIRVRYDVREGGLDLGPRLLTAMDVCRRGHADSVRAHGGDCADAHRGARDRAGPGAALEATFPRARDSRRPCLDPCCELGQQREKDMNQPEKDVQTMERLRIKRWRFEQFVALGYNESESATLAPAPVDLGIVRLLIGAGCRPETVSRIVL